MAMTADQYREQLQSLLPSGPAWPRGDDAQLTQLLDAMAAEFARVDGRLGILRDEADPRATFEMLADWERVAGLPGKCLTGIVQTEDERRGALVRHLTERGGQSSASFIALAAKLGFSVTITEFRPLQAGSLAGDVVSNGDWVFAWRVNAPATTIEKLTAGDAAGEPLAKWGNEALECAINDDAPGHTVVQFTYG